MPDAVVRIGRPVGEVALAMLAALDALAARGHKPTTREMADRAQVSRAAARRCIGRLVQNKTIAVVGRHVVPHSKKPVAEYGRQDCQIKKSRPGDDLGSAMSLWR